jgi:hypothetical protein
MSSLPPDASETPPQDAGEGESAGPPTTPRWAVPAVPPPWATPDPAAAPTPAAPAATPAASAPATEPEPEPEPAPAPAATPAASAPAAPATEPLPAPEPAPVPSWAVQPVTAPQVPITQPPYGQPGYGQPAQAGPSVQPAWAVAAPAPLPRKPLFSRQKWLPTVAVAGIMAGVVLGGIGLDQVIPSPSAGTVSVGSSVTIVGAPGWVRADDGTGPVILQKGNARIVVEAEPYSGTASAALASVEDTISRDVVQASFGAEQDGTIGGREVAMSTFGALVAGDSGSGTIDGELICMIAGDNVVIFEAVTPQGGLGDVRNDVKAMASSVEVGQ